MVQSISVEANLHLAVKLQPDLNYSNDTISRLNFKKKIKVEIEPKFCCTRHCVCFNFSKTIGYANMKLCTIDLHPGVSVIKVFVTSTMTLQLKVNFFSRIC